MPTVTVEIDTQAKVTVSVAGTPGVSCQELTRPLEAALGKTVADRPTHEMLQHARQPVQAGQKRWHRSS